jgi:hypothetical protein
MLDALALIDLTTIFDEFNIKFSRQKAKQKVKGELLFYCISRELSASDSYQIVIISRNLFDKFFFKEA